MKAISNINKWTNAHSNITLDVLRVAFGAFLFWKGIQFASQTEVLVDLMQPNDPTAATMVLAHYIALAHLSGGILVALGLLTRMALLFQLPLLVGAVVVCIMRSPDMFNLLQASLGLIFAVFFLIVGSGKHSVDYTLKMHA